MIVAFNRSFARWGLIFGFPAVAIAPLNLLLHHEVAMQIAGSSHPMCERAALVPEAVHAMAARSICHCKSAVVPAQRREILITK